MKTLIPYIFSFFLLVPLAASAQKHKMLNKKGSVYFETEIMQPGKTKKEMFNGAMGWFHKNFPNANAVIKKKVVPEKIIALAKVPNAVKTATGAVGNLHYQLEFAFEEGKTVVTMRNMKYNHAFPIGRYIYGKGGYEKGSKNALKVKKTTTRAANKLLASINKSMNPKKTMVAK